MFQKPALVDMSWPPSCLVSSPQSLKNVCWENFQRWEKKLISRSRSAPNKSGCRLIGSTSLSSQARGKSQSLGTGDRVTYLKHNFSQLMIFWQRVYFASEEELEAEAGSQKAAKLDECENFANPKHFFGLLLMQGCKNRFSCQARCWHHKSSLQLKLT